MREGEGAQPQFCGLMEAALDLCLALAKHLIPMTSGRCLHLSGSQCPHVYNGDKRVLPGQADARVPRVFRPGDP